MCPPRIRRRLAGRALCALLSGGAALSPGGCQRRPAPPAPPPALPSAAAERIVFWQEPFAELQATRWRHERVGGTGMTQYASADLDGRPCLAARSEAGASILLTAVRYPAQTYPWLSWSWRVDDPVEAEALEQKEGSDAAARLYVYFETAGLPWQKHSLDYVWSLHLPTLTRMESAFSAKSKILVVESGRAALGRWGVVARNVLEDYRAAFGEEPPDVIAIALMTDTDNTGETALTYFDDLEVATMPPAEAP